LTLEAFQSGEPDYDSGMSKCGDAPLRTMLYEAAQVLLTRGSKWSWLKAWHAGGPAARNTSGHGRGRQAPGRGSAPDVGRR